MGDKCGFNKFMNLLVIVVSICCTNSLHIYMFIIYSHFYHTTIIQQSSDSQETRMLFAGYVKNKLDREISSVYEINGDPNNWVFNKVVVSISNF